MNVIVQSKTVKITEAIRAFAVQSSRKLLKHGRKVTQVTVFIELVKRKKNDAQAASAKFLVDLPGKNVVVQERARDVYQAMHEAAKGSVRKLSRVKERRLRRPQLAWR